MCRAGSRCDNEGTSEALALALAYPFLRRHTLTHQAAVACGKNFDKQAEQAAVARTKHAAGVSRHSQCGKPQRKAG